MGELDDTYHWRYEGPHFVPQLKHPADPALDGVCVGKAEETERVSASPGGWIPLELVRVLSARLQPHHFS